MPYSKLPAIGAVLALLALITALFFPAIFDGKLLAPLDITTRLLPPWSADSSGLKPHNHFPSDAVTQYLPYRIFAEKSFREDGYIGWNPYEMGGYSLAANTMALPGSWPMQLHRFLPFKDAWNIGIISEFIIAGLGMLAFLRARKLPWLPCLIGAVAFMLNAQFIIWIYHRWALGSFCWLPWVLWAFSNGFAQKSIHRRTLLLPAFLALALLGGSLQHLVFVILACGCIAAGSFDFRRPLSNSPSIIGWAFAIILALGISAFSLVPQISGYLSNIAIGHTRGGIGYENGISQIISHMALIPARIWPWLAGDPQSIDGWKLLKSDFMSLNYIGTIPMLLGFISLFLKDIPKAAKWLIAVGLLTPLTPLVGPLYHRVELLFILGAAWATAELLKKLPTLSSSIRWPRWLIVVVAAIGALLLVGACLPSCIRTPLEKQIVSKAIAKSADSQSGDDPKWIESRALEWTDRFSILHPRTAWVYGLLVLGSTGLVLSSYSPLKNQKKHPLLPLPHSAGHCLILAATALELSTLFLTWTTFSSPDDLAPKNAAIEAVRSLAGPHRVLHAAPDASFTATFAAPNLLASHTIPSIDGYESIQYRSTLTATSGFPDAERLTLAGVGLAIHPAGSTQPGTETWPIVETLGNFSLRQNPAVPSPIIAGSSSPAPATLSAIFSALDSCTPIQPLVHTANRWTFEVPLGTSWIRIAQNWHPGWQWKVPGQTWRPFQNGSDAACWIDTLPAGTQRIEAQFFSRPQWLTFTSLGSALALLALALVWISRWPLCESKHPTVNE
jgi:hypothetical protein